jgi:CRP/FNR family transcriptional regulator, cyclic AMP receptor protein
MELVSRMMDGSIAPPGDREPAPAEAPAKLRQDDKITYLQRVQLFEGCSSRQLRAIARIAEVEEVAAGAELARAGDPGDRFFVIVDGAARIEVSAEKQSRIGPGQFFGEMSLLDGEPRSATVVADTAMRLLVIHRRDFMTLLGEVPGLTERILITLSQRVRNAEKALTA